jgi:hypothetical protein
MNREQLFVNYFLNTQKFPYEVFNIIAYSCLIRYFLQYNICTKNAKQEKSDFIYFKPEVYGLDEMWNMAYTITDSEIKDFFAKDLCSVYYSIYKSGKVKFPEVLNAFIDSNMKHVKKINSDYFLNVLKRFVYK